MQQLQLDELATELEHIVMNEDIRTVFQPIVSLRTGEVLGYEALSRGPEGSVLESPCTLFDVAEHGGNVWELEYLCRRLAIYRFSQFESDKLLFINVNPNIIADPRFRHGCTSEQMIARKLDTSSIVFEITERTSVSNYLEFCNIIKHYTEQGYRIAIDDTGAGYSGLNLLANVKPQYMKIDMSLIHGIDKDPFKLNLLRFLVEFANSTGLTLIAEGIETREEAGSLLDLGVEFGQGYYLCKPSSNLEIVNQQIVDSLQTMAMSKVAMSLKTITTTNVGEFTCSVQWLSPETACAAVEDIFNANEDIMGIPIVASSKAVGLVMRDRFYSKLGSKYGYSLYHNRPISFLMDTDPLLVDKDTPLEQVSKLAMGRRSQRLYDNIIITHQDRYYGVVTVKDLLERITELEVRYAKYSQPLTGLPGNLIIESEVDKGLSAPEFSVIYVDLDSFKAYNDVYGFERGDDILRFTAELLLQQFGKTDFVGHIGGDDFVVMCKRIDINDDVISFQSTFDREIVRFYNEADISQGYISSKNRRGEEERFPIMSISIAIVQNTFETLHSYHQVANKATILKRLCKQIQGSVIMYDHDTQAPKIGDLSPPKPSK